MTSLIHAPRCWLLAIAMPIGANTAAAPPSAPSTPAVSFERARLSTAVEHATFLAAAGQERPHAADDFTAWLESSACTVRLSGREPVDSPAIDAAEAALRDVIARWASMPEPSPQDRTAVLAEEQAILEATISTSDRFAARHRLDDASIDRLRRRLEEFAETRRGRRGNPFLPDWMRPRTVSPSALAERVAQSIDRAALLAALGERAAIELGLLRGDPPTARFRRLLVDSQIDAAAHRIDALASQVLDETAPEAPPPETVRDRGAAADGGLPPISFGPSPSPVPQAGNRSTFESIVEALLADVPTRGE
ncbi:MAG: hypothetical protein ACO3ZY_04385 [Phycisphaerales bacterium]